MLDEIRGIVYNPNTKQGPGLVNRDDVITGVRHMQVADRYILAALSRNLVDNSPRDAKQMDGYFLLDTQLGTQVQFNDLGSLQQRARTLGIAANLEPVATVFARFYRIPPDLALNLVRFLPSLAGTILVVLLVFSVVLAQPPQAQ
jgi:hypothetical protein